MKTTKPKLAWLSMNRLVAITYVLVALIIICSGLKFWLLSMRYNALFDSSTYQAVTLTNGQTFFGHLNRYGMKTYLLTDVYYLQRNTETATTTTDETKPEEVTQDSPKTDSGLTLQAIVSDLHKPYNYVVLNRDQIVFWQSLSADSPILDSIAEAKKKE